MVLDATLAYLHYLSIFALFGFLTTQALLLRRLPDALTARLIGRTDLWYFGASMVVLLTGFMRLGMGAKGAQFYLDAWPVYVKIGLFVLVGVLSVSPTLTYIRWRRELDHDPAWAVPETDWRKARRMVMIEVHLAALIPIFAVIMARGLGR